MALIHAAFSAGGAIGALSAGSLVSIGMDLRHVYLAALVPLGAVVLAAVKHPVSAGRVLSARGEAKLYKNVPLVLVALVAALVFLS
jgi:hypothetical protein